MSKYAVRTARLKIQARTEELATCKTPAEREGVQRALDAAEWDLERALKRGARRLEVA